MSNNIDLYTALQFKKIIKLLKKQNELTLENNNLLAQIKEELQMLSAEMQALVDEVAELDTVIDSAVAALSGLTGQVTALLAELNLSAGDRAKADELVAQLNAAEAELAAAIPANTPTP